MEKQIGYIGLGKMGKNMVLRLLEHGWQVVAFDRSEEAVAEVAKAGAEAAHTLAEMVSHQSVPRTIWIMVPHAVVDDVLANLTPLLEKGDTIIDGGNSPHQETMRRAADAEAKEIGFLDIGVSGGPGGAREGACMMAGGREELYRKLDEAGFFRDTCVVEGWGYMGASGAGHFVKMVHNGIEYGMMQAIAEGFDLLRHNKEFDLDLDRVTGVYSHGSVITSSLVSWLADGYRKFGRDLSDISGRASASGEGKWTVEAGERESIAMPIIEGSLGVRAASQEQPSYQGKVLSTMRGEFGGHPVRREEGEPEVL